MLDTMCNYLYNSKTNTCLHFSYTRSAIGCYIACYSRVKWNLKDARLLSQHHSNSKKNNKHMEDWKKNEKNINITTQTRKAFAAKTQKLKDWVEKKICLKIQKWKRVRKHEQFAMIEAYHECLFFSFTWTAQCIQMIFIKQTLKRVLNFGWEMWSHSHKLHFNDFRAEHQSVRTLNHATW